MTEQPNVLRYTLPGEESSLHLDVDIYGRATCIHEGLAGTAHLGWVLIDVLAGKLNKSFLAADAEEGRGGGDEPPVEHVLLSGTNHALFFSHRDGKRGLYCLNSEGNEEVRMALNDENSVVCRELLAGLSGPPGTRTTGPREK